MISFDNVSKQYGRRVLFLEASATIQPGEKVGLVGPNGAGKTTVFRLITGEEETDAGQVLVERGLRIGYFSQDVGAMSGATVLETVLDGAGPVAAILSEIHHIEHALGDPERADELDALCTRLGDLQEKFEALGGYALETKARKILYGLGFEDPVVDGDVGQLSGGWKMRVALARILLQSPDLMLLDEPTNHLDVESIIWLEGFLRESDSALLMTSHDREFMNRVVRKVIELDAGDLTTYTGDLDFYERERAIREREQEAQYKRQQKMLEKELRFIDRFKARASHASQVQSRIKKIDKIEKFEPPRKIEHLRFEFKRPPRSGEDVVRIRNVEKSFGGRRVTSLDLSVRRGDRWCVMGQNGAGKSTLLKLIAGALEPDRGAVSLGSNVRLGYFAQHTMELLQPDKTVFETLLDDFPTASQGSLRTLAGCFGFPGDDADKVCSVLSGGEKARVVMARMLFDPPNLLVLDEPTNHLDVATKDMLVDALREFEGTMIFVSHDRRFLSALSNRVIELAPEGPGTDARTYPGGYQEYVAQTGREAPGLRSA